MSRKPKRVTVASPQTRLAMARRPGYTEGPAVQVYWQARADATIDERHITEHR